MPDRRSSPRVVIEVEVSMTSESNFFAGLSGDVSSGGIFVQTYEARSIGTKLDLIFALPDGPVHARGVVRWTQEKREGVEPGLGIAFETIEAADRARIEAFCKARPPLYYDVDEQSGEIRISRS